MKKINFGKLKENILDLFYPRHIKCIFCGEELNDKTYNDTCETCLKTLPFITHSCSRCGAPVALDNDGVCLNCKANNFDFNLARSVFAYSDKVVAVVHKFKYSKMKFLYEPLANYLCEYLSTWEISPDIITCVPLYESKQKRRGYNQSELMARYLAEKSKIPFHILCTKIVDNASQAELDLKRRKENVKGVYKFNNEYRQMIKNKTILIIDDVYTTGSTCNELSKIIKANGSKEIYVLTLAHGLGNQKL